MPFVLLPLNGSISSKICILVAKLQGYAPDIIEDLYRANEVYVETGDVQAAQRRLDYQHSAITGVKLPCSMAQLAMEQGSILPKQYEQIAKRLYDCRDLCGAWIKHPPDLCRRL